MVFISMSLYNIISFLRADNSHIAENASFGKKIFPKDILYLVFSYLDTLRDVKGIGLVNRHLYSQIFSDPILLDFLLQKHFPDSCANSQSDVKSLARLRHLMGVEHHKEIGKYRLRTIKCNYEIRSILKYRNQLIAFCSDSTENVIEIWDFKTGKEIHTFWGCGHRILVHENQLIALSLLDATIKIWDLGSGKEMSAPDNQYSSILVHHNQLISGSFNGTIKILDLGSRKEVYALEGHHKVVTKLLMHKNQLISGTVNGQIKVWDLGSRKEVHTFSLCQMLPAEITSLVVHKNQLIAFSKYLGEIKIWDLESGKEMHTLADPQGSVTALLVHNDQIISGFTHGTIKIWDLVSGKEMCEFGDHENAVVSLSIYQDQLISTSDDDTTKIWDLKSGKENHCLQHSCTLYPHRTKPILRHENHLISASDDGTIQIWDLKSGKEVQTLAGHHSWVTHIMMDEDSLITGYNDKTIKIRDFSFPSLSPYSNDILEESLSILEKMALYPKIAVELAETLDPDFKDRLSQHCFPFTSSIEPILRVQTEVYVEMLLNEIHAENWQKVSQILDQLILINPQNFELHELQKTIDPRSNKIYNAFWAISSRIIPKRETETSTSSLMRKEEAVLAFKQSLKTFCSKK
jgi:WD40 repeat protein